METGYIKPMNLQIFKRRVIDMSRLTHRYTDGQAFISMNKVSAMMENEVVGEPITKLADYEDICDNPSELKEVWEKSKAKKEQTESHDEKSILESCISLMDEVFYAMIKYMKFMEFEFDNEDEEERPTFSISYFRLVQKLFLSRTNHSGGTSTRQKCVELGVSDDTVIELDWSEEE